MVNTAVCRGRPARQLRACAELLPNHLEQCSRREALQCPVRQDSRVATLQTNWRASRRAGHRPGGHLEADARRADVPDGRAGDAGAGCRGAAAVLRGPGPLAPPRARRLPLPRTLTHSRPYTQPSLTLTLTPDPTRPVYSACGILVCCSLPRRAGSSACCCDPCDVRTVTRWAATLVQSQYVKICRGLQCTVRWVRWCHASLRDTVLSARLHGVDRSRLRDDIRSLITRGIPLNCLAVARQGALRHHPGLERAGGVRPVVRRQELRRRWRRAVRRLRPVQLLLRPGLLPAAHGRVLHLLRAPAAVRAPLLTGLDGTFPAHLRRTHLPSQLVRQSCRQPCCRCICVSHNLVMRSHPG